jgi:putative nucleotidyltransferase with HDIG domain
MSNSEFSPTRRNIFLIALLLVFSVLLLVALLIPTLGRLSDTSLQVGDVAAQDYSAPYSSTYESQVLTEIQRAAAEKAVPPVYTPPDTSIARTQMESLRSALAFITNVRADEYASYEQKLSDLAALEDIQLNRETMDIILALSDSRWQIVQQEAIIVLEQVMRNTIREGQLDLTLHSVPRLVSLSLPEDQAAIVVDLVWPFVVPNSYYNETLSKEAKQQARDSVEPITRSYIIGENIVQRGQVITDTDLEALQIYGLAQPESNWRDLVSAVSLTILVSVLLIIYLHRYPIMKSGILDLRGLALYASLFVGFLIVARVTIPGHIVLPYVYPVAAFSLTVSTLFGARLAFISTLPLAILVAYGQPTALELTIFYTLGGYFGILALKRGQRFTSFIWAGTAIVLVGAVVVLIFRLPDPTTDWIGIATLIGVSVINGVASASISILLQYFMAQLLGTTTALQLIEISRPDHPLMQFILRNAPGTYQHSLQVANLAEQAAERIEADPLLTRVGALYHDAGKALNPFFFIENQVPGTPNPHDDLDPESSADIIIRHVPDGLELAQKYRLPGRIQEFISEHHGTMITRYQYVTAVDKAGGEEDQVDKEQFRYPGPRPRSKETALLMLADGCEARMRAERPSDKEELRELVQSVIGTRLTAGQLNNTDLTLHDLDAIVDSFTATLRGVYHPRIEYPKLDQIPSSHERPTIPAPAKNPNDTQLEPESQEP